MPRCSCRWTAYSLSRLRIPADAPARVPAARPGHDAPPSILEQRKPTQMANGGIARAHRRMERVASTPCHNTLVLEDDAFFEDKAAMRRRRYEVLLEAWHALDLMLWGGGEPKSKRRRIDASTASRGGPTCTYVPSEAAQLAHAVSRCRAAEARRSRERRRDRHAPVEPRSSTLLRNDRSRLPAPSKHGTVGTGPATSRRSTPQPPLGKMPIRPPRVELTRSTSWRPSHC